MTLRCIRRAVKNLARQNSLNPRQATKFLKNRSAREVFLFVTKIYQSCSFLFPVIFMFDETRKTYLYSNVLMHGLDQKIIRVSFTNILRDYFLCLVAIHNKALKK